MVWVRPGVLLVFAILSATSELIRLDLPTLERPRKAISGAVGVGNCLGSAADVTKRVRTFMVSLWLGRTGKSKPRAPTPLPSPFCKVARTKDLADRSPQSSRNIGLRGKVAQTKELCDGCGASLVWNHWVAGERFAKSQNYST